MMKTALEKLRNFGLRLGLFTQKALPPSAMEDCLQELWPQNFDLDLVRIGSSSSDGGYLVPNNVGLPDRVFSPGVSDNSDFESYYLELGIPCELIDGSIASPPVSHDLLTFNQLWLGADSSVDTTTLETWVQKRAKPDELLLLQMDIEGSEFEVLLSTPSDVLNRFGVLVIEFHDLFSVRSRQGNALFMATIRRLKENHEIVHLHPNNCCGHLSYKKTNWPQVMEITLVRKDFLGQPLGKASLPHQLDQPNTSRPGLSFY